jgi:hypothetical protein
MNEQAQHPPQEGDTPIAPIVKTHSLEEILGIVSVAEGVEHYDNGAGNSTRWVFDVEVVSEGELEVQLLDMRGREPKTDIKPSFHITPTSREFYGAGVWGETVGTNLTLHFSKACKFRVDVDIIGTNRR